MILFWDTSNTCMPAALDNHVAGSHLCEGCKRKMSYGFTTTSIKGSHGVRDQGDNRSPNMLSNWDGFLFLPCLENKVIER